MGSTSSSGRSSGQLELDARARGSCQLLEGPSDLGRHDRQVGRLAMERQRAGLGQAERPQVLDQAGEHAGLLEDRSEMLRVRRVDAIDDRFDVALDDG